MTYTVFQTAWAAFGYVANGKRLVATFLPASEADIRRAIRKHYPDAVEAADQLLGFREQVIQYFAGKPTKFTVDVDLSDVPPFRRTVLQACRRTAYGKTTTYADLARAVGKPGAPRAVGGAMAHNPLPLVIPCHRVLRTDGSLGGFSGPDGVEQKKRLLKLEGTII
jgi:methylated-DNA-[protein]-cysteine S-methyltransferase